MASTVDALITKFRTRIYPDCDDTTARSLFTDAHHYLLRRLKMRNATVNISLTQGTRQYDLSDAVVRIHEAYYQPSADESTHSRLGATTYDQLVAQPGNWRDGGKGQPMTYFVTSATDTDSAKAQIGFIPIPNETTAGTYPRVTLHVTQYALLTTTETLPSQVVIDDVYLYEMARRWSIVQDMDRTAYWTNMATTALNDAQDMVEHKSNEAPDITLLSPFAYKVRRPY